MPNVKVVPGVAATRAKQHARRTNRARQSGGWMEAIKVVFLLERPRARRSSPSMRQIALVVVSAGIVIVIVRVTAQRAKSRAGAAGSPPPDAAATSADAPAAEVADADDNDNTGDAGGDDNAVPGNESPLADRVQDEMFHRSDAVHPDA